MVNHLSEKKKQVIRILGIVLVIAAAAASIALFFTLRHPAEVDLSRYVSVGKNSLGETASSVDLDALLSDLHYSSSDDRTGILERFPEVRALMEMKLRLSETDDPESVLVTAELDTDTLLNNGIQIKETSWTQQIKGQIASSDIPLSSPVSVSVSPSPEADFNIVAGIYLTSLADENGDGYNLRAVCERGPG